MRDTEIMIEFRRPPLLLFRKTECETIEPNRLILYIQPEEGINFRIHAKKPGPAIRLAAVNLDFSYTDFGPTPAATGYERLLYDVTVGDSTLFHRSDMVEAAWKIATPILEAWSAHPPRDFPNYAAGTWGPEAADDFLERDGRRWWKHAVSQNG
jgi:glucose-6-phosphate 1-dehydrogenase